MELLDNKFNLITISHHLTILIFMYDVWFHGYFSFLSFLFLSVFMIILVSGWERLHTKIKQKKIKKLRCISVFLSSNQVAKKHAFHRLALLIWPIQKLSKTLCETINFDHEPLSQMMPFLSQCTAYQTDRNADNNNDLYTVHVLLGIFFFALQMSNAKC